MRIKKSTAFYGVDINLITFRQEKKTTPWINSKSRSKLVITLTRFSWPLCVSFLFAALRQCSGPQSNEKFEIFTEIEYAQISLKLENKQFSRVSICFFGRFIVTSSHLWERNVDESKLQHFCFFLNTCNLKSITFSSFFIS